MDRLITIEQLGDIPAHLRDTPVGRLLEYQNLGRPHDNYDRAEILVGMCMDFRKVLNIPDRFAYVIRTGGANLRHSEFKVSYAIAVGGVHSVALIGHDHCGMVGLAGNRETFVQGLVERAGWEVEAARDHFDRFAPLFEIGNAIGFLLSEAARLRQRYPRILIAPLYYFVDEGRIAVIREDQAPGPAS